jgi:hypothetical protein
MTPKEKAEELVGKCYDTFINDEDEHYTGTAWRLSKQCALIAVDEIKEQLLENLSNDVSAIHAIYWEKVKQEIEKL